MLHLQRPWGRRRRSLDGRTDMQDAFSKRHPAVNFAFFLGAIGCAVVIQHPAYVVLGIVCGCAYYLLLHGNKGLRGHCRDAACLLHPDSVAQPPVQHPWGPCAVLRTSGRPYTLEALLYGLAIGGVFLQMLAVVWVL